MRLLACILVFSSIAAGAEPAWVTRAAQNGKLAREALDRSLRVTHAWLRLTDPVTGLLPRRDNNPNWVVRDSAADLYPFMVIASYFLEPTLYDGAMHDILRREMRLTMRVGRLSDDFLAGGGGFVRPSIVMDEIIFGSSEYMKDGLLPITEILGETPWYHRMRGIATDMVKHAPYTWNGRRLPAQTSEINGNALQVLSRMYWRTRDAEYLDNLITIGDFYFLHQLPKTNYLPVHDWDISTDQPKRGVFLYSDHGNEIVGGLSEAFVVVSSARPEKAAEWKKPFQKLIGRVIEVGRNPDGVWYASVDVPTGKVVDTRHAHCWGYMFNGIYTAYLMTGDEKYRQAVEAAMDGVVRKPEYLFDESGAGRNWGANAYSDSIEGALVLINRLPHDGLDRALDDAMLKYYKRQKDNGIVEYWYGDGNYIRTAMMYAFYKSQGAFLSNWHDRVELGAVRNPGGVNLVVTADSPWAGLLRFDIPRHREHWNMGRNYPRLNEWPEWFTVEQDTAYEVRVNGGAARRYYGFELRKGLPLAVGGGEKATIEVGLVR